MNMTTTIIYWQNNNCKPDLDFLNNAFFKKLKTHTKSVTIQIMNSHSHKYTAVCMLWEYESRLPIMWRACMTAMSSVTSHAISSWNNWSSVRTFTSPVIWCCRMCTIIPFVCNVMQVDCFAKRNLLYTNKPENQRPSDWKVLSDAVRCSHIRWNIR